MRTTERRQRRGSTELQQPAAMQRCPMQRRPMQMTKLTQTPMRGFESAIVGGGRSADTTSIYRRNRPLRLTRLAFERLQYYRAYE